MRFCPPIGVAVSQVLCRAALAFAAFLPLVAACGKKPEKGGGGPRVGKVEQAFQAAAHKSGVPIRFLMAAGHRESGLASERATANYQLSPDATGGDEPMAVRGTAVTDTAFGLTFEELGLDPADPKTKTLETQIEAYAAFVASQVQDLSLVANPRTTDDKSAWLENIANIHRNLANDGRNVQALFARELIQTLNTGFIWQRDDGEALELTPETPPLDPNTFPENVRLWFNLKADEGKVPGSTFMRVGNSATGEYENHPRSVEVIHCPLSLSACLKLQSGGDDDEGRVHLAAHYVIPQDDSIFKGVIQVARHKDVVVVTDKLGRHQPIDDAIVIMLVGNSGRIVDGRRVPALPDWFSDNQLRRLGQLVGDVCSLLASENPAEVSRAQCTATTGDLGVQFRRQATAEEYRWGDLPDYEPTIFDAYIKSPGGLGTEVAFEFQENRRRFTQGEEIPLTLLFNSTVKSVKLERLLRCRDGKVVWEAVGSPDVRGEKKLKTSDKRFDSGPNRNGEHFYRARAYAGDGHLIGWSVARIILSSYEAEPKFAADDVCALAAQR